MKKCGYIAIVGRSNVGKSTFLNYITGHKLSITSRKPQTTRHQIKGIKIKNSVQYIYVDTPGFHRGQKVINRFMNKEAQNIIYDVNIILFFTEARKWNSTDDWVLNKLAKANKPVILVINKVDTLKKVCGNDHFKVMASQKYEFSSVFLISSKHGHNISSLESKISEYLPQTDHFLFDVDQITDRPKIFTISEIIREKLIRSVGEEVPYQVTVVINDYKIRKEKKLVEIYATIFVEQKGQKIMIIGGNGLKIKTIGIESRKDIELFLGSKVFLQLWVKVKENWSDNSHVLKSLGYN